jgi:hypothetical protein
MTAPVITGGSITGVALSGNTLTNPVITGGSINNTTVGATTRSTGAFTTLASNGATTFTAGTASTSTTTGTAVITGGLGVSGRINAANFDGIVGANTAAAGNFTTLGATGVATFSAGTVSAPAITTTGDTNTGIFFPAADTIAFTEGGVEAMRIASSSFVGIGTNNPNYKLEVSGTLGVESTGYNIVAGLATLFEESANRTRRNRLEIGGDASGQFINATWSSGGTTAMRFQVDGSEAMRITSGGNVGIGTSSPNTTAANRVVLDVNGTTSALLNISSGGTRRATFYSDSTDCVFGSITSIPLEFLTGGTERMRINSGGDLLIGTTSNNGSTSNSAKTVSGAFTTNNGSAINTTINVATDLVTLPSSFGMCLFRVFLGGVGSPADSESLAIICVNASSASQTNLKAGGWAVISLSGLTVRATQNQFTGANIGWSLIRLS